MLTVILSLYMVMGQPVLHYVTGFFNKNCVHSYTGMHASLEKE